jgi:hypothetical protein
MAELHLPQSADEHGGDRPAVRHETTDVDIRGLLIFAVGLLATGVAIHLLVWVLLLYFDAREARKTTIEYPLAATQGNRVPPEPRLQTNPRQDLLDLRAQEDEVLRSYGWIDRNAGVVRIPIEEAMRLTLERGLPARREGSAPR